MSESRHQHNFEIKYRRVDGEVQVINPTKCIGCDQLIFAEHEGYKWITTLIPRNTQITYEVRVVEAV